MSPALLAKLNAATLALFYSVLPVATLNATGDPAQWAEKKRWIARGESPFSQDERIKFDFAITPWAEEPCKEAVSQEVHTMALMWGSGMGKALALDTPIFTTEGWKTMRDIQPGDRVFGTDGNPCMVTYVTEAAHGRPCYEVQFTDGSVLVTDEEHLWKTTHRRRHTRKEVLGERRIHKEEGYFTTKQIAQSVKVRGQNRHSIPVAPPLQLPLCALPISPYVLGVWLGDGDSSGGVITFDEKDREIIDRIKERGHTITAESSDNRRPNVKRARIDGPIAGVCVRGHERLKPGCCPQCMTWAQKKFRTGEPMPERRLFFTQRLKELGLINNKHIPSQYLTASREDRMELLRGLIDTDGHIDKIGNADVVTCQQRLAKDIKRLVASLGMKPVVHANNATLYGRILGIAYRVRFFPVGQVAYVKRKAERIKESRASSTRERAICDVRPVASVPVKCISVDADDHLYLAGEALIATHNTLATFANVLGYVVDEAPAHVLWALKTQDQMDEISKKQIAPFIAANPCLASKFVTPKSRDSGNTISGKLFAGGSLSMIGTESITGFRANRSPVVIADEVDSWIGEVAGEGDPLWLMLRRSDGFPRSIRMIASTPGTKGQSRIEHWYQQSDQRKWFIPCRDCGAEQLIVWSQVKWEGDCRGARWHCEACGCPHTDEERRHAVSQGLWKPTAPFHGIRGYWINGLNSLLPPNKGFRDRLHQWAQEVTDIAHAKDPKMAKKVIVQTLFTETFEDADDAKPEWAELMKRKEPWDPKKLPSGIIWLSIGVDIHPDRIECTVIGWGRNEETWVLEHNVWKGDPREIGATSPWASLEACANAPRTREDGCTLIVRAVGVDTGHPQTQRAAYAFIRPRQSRNWFAFKGSSLVDSQVIVRPKKTTTVDKVKLMTVGGHRIKALVYDRAIIASNEGIGFMHFHDSLSVEWFEQFLSETSKGVFKGGVRYREFTKPTVTTRNESLDCFCYAYAAKVALGPILDETENARLLAEKAERDRVSAGQPEEREAQPVQHSGFVNSGRWRI